MFNRFTWSGPSEHRIAITKAYEPWQPSIFCALAARLAVTTVIDVGANVGQYSIIASNLPTRPVGHAFEAEEAAVRELMHNIRLNGLESRVTVHGLAVSDRARTLRFGVASAMAGNNGALDTTFHDPAVYAEVREVLAVALDDVLPLRGERIAIKFDLEGHEPQALAGARALLSNNDVVMQIEIYRPGEVEAMLNGLGYTQIFAAGPDCYFTNSPVLHGETTMREVLQDAARAQIDDNLKHARQEVRTWRARAEAGQAKAAEIRRELEAARRDLGNTKRLLEKARQERSMWKQRAQIPTRTRVKQAITRRLHAVLNPVYRR